MDAALTARANATLREQFVRRGLATPEELDRVGFVSHEQLMEWADHGELVERTQQLEEAWGLALLRGAEFDARIKRGSHGRFGVMGLLKSDHKVKGARAEEPKLQHGPNPSAVPSVPHAARRLSRNRTGPRMSVQAPRAPQRSEQRQPIRTLQGRRGPVRGKHFDVYATPRSVSPDEEYTRSETDMPERMSAEQMRQEIVPRAQLHRAGFKRLDRLAREARGAAREAQKNGNHEQAAQKREESKRLLKAQTDTKELAAHGAKELYDQRYKRLEKRVAKRVKKIKGSKEQTTPAAGNASSPHELTAAETDFNDVGKVSQKTLLAYATDASSKPTTAEMYRTSDGVYHPSRAQLHAHVIDGLLRERGADGSLCYTCPYLKSPGEHPTVVFTGGGYASGKGGVIKKLQAEGRWPGNAFVLDPDVIKAELPEFQATALSDPEANLRVYQEAWDIAQHAMKEAQDRKLNVVVDGITNTHADEVAARVKSFTDAGYVNPEIHYVSIPTDEASRRAIKRAAEGKTAADRRMIPDTIMRSVHRDVSATIPGVMSRAGEMGATVHVYDNNQGTDEITGQPRMAKEVATALPTGQIEHQDSAAFQAILNKANEPVPGVSDPKGSGASIAPPVNTNIDRHAVAQVGQAVEQALPETQSVRLSQPVTDPEGLLALAEERGLPGYKALLDMGSGIAEALGGTTHDATEVPFEQIGQDIQQNMDQPHVIIAPVKGLKRAQDKLAADGSPDDASHLYDALRATVSVPTAQDLPHAIQTIASQAEARGWTVERVKNRLVQGPNDNRMPGTGYGDISLILRAPQEHGGIAAELQVNTNPMWWTKQVGPGHTFYEVERGVKGNAQVQNRRLTPEEQAVVATAQDTSRQLYDNAWGMALNGGGGPAIAETILGDGRERILQTLQQLATEASSVAPVAA